ncbi:MAG: PepSY-like domain-containing protein [Fluviicola sp.]|nr:PepSY-like domain-containing protein [Fluviicola sp.]
MKKTIATSVLVLSLAACGTAQKEEKATKGLVIPDAVSASFKQHYPNAEDVEWEMEDNNYEAEFEANETETSVVMDANGGILETESEIEVTMLPKAAQDYMTTNYKGQKVTEAAKIVLADGTVQYEAEVKRKDVLFDANGVFIEEETEE